MGDSSHAGYSSPMPILIILMYMYEGKLKFIFITGEAGKRVGCTKPFDDLGADQKRLQASNYSCIKLVKRMTNTTKNTTTGGNRCRFVMPTIPGGSK